MSNIIKKMDIVNIILFNTIRSSLLSHDRIDLFGEIDDRITGVFFRSYVGDMFPELWFELPLTSDPWCDLHVLTSRRTLDDKVTFDDDVFCPKVFKWFASADNVRQLALSHDLSKGIFDSPAVQLLVNTTDHDAVHSFLDVCHHSSAKEAYDLFVNRIPKGWYPCYFGTFPQRDELFLRIECIPDANEQIRYSSDKEALRNDLLSAGYDPDECSLELMRFMSSMPFPIEFQFDVKRDGTASDVMSASLRFHMPGTRNYFGPAAFVPEDENVVRLMERLCDMRLSDDRWKKLCETAFSKRLGRGDETFHLTGIPAFIKVRFDHDGPLDSKAYIRCEFR